MARQKRKAPKGKPITQHQLFPAVVALWFGALFGLGSLAVRPSLMEELVIKSRIDLLIPAAAPPLGMTARMLVALVLAALGAMIGAAIARRIARPRQQVRERKRANLSTRDEGAESYDQVAYADASTRNPRPVEADPGAPGVLASRRRALAIEPEEGDFVPHDMAPLPGGAPQIFDIAAAGLNDAAANSSDPALTEAIAEPAEPIAAPPPVAVALDWASAAPVLPPIAAATPIPVPQAIETQRQLFQTAGPVAADEPVGPTEPLAPALAPASEDGRQVFGMAQPETPRVEQPRQIFGAPVTGDHVSREFIESQGFRTSVFVQPEPNPLFVSPQSRAGPVEVLAPAPELEAPALPAGEPVAVAAEPAVPAAPVFEATTTASDPEPTLPNPASLGMDDLSARLAESMRRRRASRSANAGQAASEAIPLAEEAQRPVTSPVAAPAPIPQAFEPAAEPVAEAARPSPDFTVPSFAVPPFTVPASAVPIAAEPALPAPEPIPTALRPLDLGGFEEDDLAQSEDLLPPRRIVMATAAPAPQLPPAAVSPPAVTSEDEHEAPEEAVGAEDNYASLLEVTPSPAAVRNPFVRVDEPEAGDEAIEPVVIFPGQAVPLPMPAAAPAAASGAEPLPFRRFDAPASAGHGQPVAANEAVNPVPAEEAERALRAAIANLQRMSGAA